MRPLLLQKEFEPIIEQVRKVIGVYGKEVRQVILVGGSAKMPKIVDYFSSNFSLPTSLGKSNIATGLALKKYKEGINILPKVKDRVKSFNKKWLIAGLVVAVSIVLGYIIYLVVFPYWNIG